MDITEGMGQQNWTGGRGTCQAGLARNRSGPLWSWDESRESRQRTTEGREVASPATVGLEARDRGKGYGWTGKGTSGERKRGESPDAIPRGRRPGWDVQSQRGCLDEGAFTGFPLRRKSHSGLFGNWPVQFNFGILETKGSRHSAPDALTGRTLEKGSTDARTNARETVA